MLIVELGDADLRQLDSLGLELQAAPTPLAAAAVLVDGVTRCLGERARCEQLVAELYAFTRRVGQTLQTNGLYDLIVATLAARVHAQQASLAVFDQTTAHLSIVATRGYPSVLVEDLRIAPGEGIIGEVFASRRPLLVTDATRELPPPHRRRYRTGSFVALPLFSGTDGLGVITLTDREDGQPFTRGDLTIARAFAAPATLGLAAARLAGQTRTLAHAAAVDPLTGLFNRRYFETRIDEEINRARRYGLELALLVIDADNFKALNDRLGHLVGDRVLRSMADTLRRSVRAFDVCTRFGGEEFAILMPGSAASSALQSAERIRQRVADYRLESDVVPAELHPTISIGVAVLAAGDGSQDLISRADRALYQAKAEGKNRVSLAE